MSEQMPEEATPELVDNTNPELRATVAQLDELLAVIAAELLEG